VETIPGALLGEYRSAEKVQIVNRITADELRAYLGRALAYRIAVAPPANALRRLQYGDRALASRTRTHHALHATVTESAVETLLAGTHAHLLW